ncbi:hypothetical protein U0N67_004953 [Vibrio parahaemolyticus]|uniref:hypothetical protein n=1 Tax=Vibrio harveyi group TaxID=717610 RepID=UPI000409B8D7|nr:MULTISPECIES: hypothetical protein [Vibrio harveyi group]EJL3960586.1 hypothetical protein [Vibrio parahaemolyticus]ELZ7201042.1 hypothetical protein [Vibrio parahaemolyticus]MBE3821502.1 hypothetical protein [Vibrio parahaemolyticus]MBM5118607.1 hypothetical protein [Vibrio parahaemolyticus]MBM5124153.1 hypothetical protein [Vibrio parahaemolyticus]
MTQSFINDVYEWSVKVTKASGYQPANDQFRALANVFTLDRMFISPIPRNVYVSDKFKVPEKYSNVIDAIKADFENGHPVNKRLSRKIRQDAIYTDNLLADWGIHHLHLGDTLIPKGKNKGLYKGNKELLFVFVTNSAVYLIGIFDHSSWTRNEVLEIVYDNWPQLLEKYELKGVVGLSREVSEQDRYELRTANVNTPLEIRGKFFMGPGGGLTAGGIGGQDVSKANLLLRAAEETEKWINDYYTSIRSAFEQQGVDLDSQSLHFHVSKFSISMMPTVLIEPSGWRIHIPSVDCPNSLFSNGFEVIAEPKLSERVWSDHRKIKKAILEPPLGNYS